METLILNSGSKEDLKLLLDIAQKLGLDLKVAKRKDLILMEAKLLNKSVNPNIVSFEEIVDACSSVRKSLNDKRKENNS